MAATTQSQPALPALPPASGRAGFGGTLASEFTKIRSVRSTYWTLLVLLVVSIGIGAAISGGTAANWSHMAPSDRPPSTRPRPAWPGCSTWASWSSWCSAR